MATLCQQCNPQATGNYNLAQCRACKQYYRIDDGRACNGYGVALEDKPPTTIKCSVCWLPVTLSEAQIEEIKTKAYWHLYCGHRVPVNGPDGVLERVRRARQQ